MPTYKEINAYRNKSHEFPAVIGCKWEDKGGGPKFVHHFLPTIAGYEAKEEIDINDQLQKYFEFAANVWLRVACVYQIRSYLVEKKNAAKVF